MSLSARSALRRRGRAALAAAAAAALGTAVLSTAPTASAADEAPGCPDVYPVTDLGAGDPVHGLTVSHGTAPDAFTGEVVGVLDDGIALGLDMIMVKLSGSKITGADGTADRGIWAGMSGSPVYAGDGRLIGAVSYGLSWSPSEYAGVTPAAAMYDLGRYEGLKLQGTGTVETTPRAVAQLHASGLRTSKAQAGFARLPMPTSVSGLRGRDLDRVAKRLGLPGGALTHGTTARASEAAGAIVPGGNVAMATSYGDVTSAGVGTVTAVCDGSVLAFGHPFGLTGKATASLHGADAIYIERDVSFGSFKVANVTAPVGRFTQDRIAGILGRLGAPPETTPVTSAVTTSEGGPATTGTTEITDPAATADLATMHLLANLDTASNAYRGGTGTLGWKITVRRPDGTTATLRRSDVYSSPWDLSYSMPWDFYSQLSTVLDNRFEKVDVVGVEQRAHLSTAFRQHQIAKVQVRRDHRWVTQGRRSVALVRAGRRLRVRAWLQPARDSDVRTQWAQFEIRVPRAARGRFGMLSVYGGQRYGRGSGGATSFPGLLRQLAHAPTNNTVTAELRIRTRKGTYRVERHVTRPAPVTGAKFFGVSVR